MIRGILWTKQTAARLRGEIEICKILPDHKNIRAYDFQEKDK